MKYKNTLGCVVLILVGTANLFAVPASAQEPSRWVDVSIEDFAETVDYPIRKTAASGYLITHGDFDGDGRMDVAKIVVNRQNAMFAIVVLLELQSGTEEHILKSGSKKEIARLAVSKLLPGHYKTACGKGYGHCEPSSPQEITIEDTGISIVLFEASETLYYWTGYMFSKVGLSD